jgi:phage FluMu protein gp41
MPRKYRFEVVGNEPLIVKGTLRFGLKIGEKVHKEFTIREASCDDMFNAEAEAHAVNTPLTYEAAMIARQLLSVGSYEGPFTVGVLRSLKPHDFALLREAQAELDARLGED